MKQYALFCALALVCIPGCNRTGTDHPQPATTAFERIHGFEPHFVLPPEQVTIKNICSDYGAIPDDGKDDTEAFRAWCSDSCRRLYIPSGTYLVNSQLRIGADMRRVFIIGERRSTTIIRLTANSTGFDDPRQPRAFIHTRRVDQHPEQNYHNYVQHLTIEIGPGNPGAIALNFHTNNTGVVKNVAIRSVGEHSRRPRIGLAVDDKWFGPGSVHYLTVRGFETGVYLGSSQNHCAFEHISITDCDIGMHACGISWRTRYAQASSGATPVTWDDIYRRGIFASEGANGYGCSIRDLVTTRCRIGLQCDIGDTTSHGHTGQVVIVDSRFLHGPVAGAAIVDNHAHVRACGVRSSGYDTVVAVAGDTTDILASGPQRRNHLTQYISPGIAWKWRPRCSEYTSAADSAACCRPGIPVQESPEYQYPQSSDEWAVMPPDTDITAALQQAIDAGVRTIFLQPRATITKTILVRNRVERIMGLGKASYIDTDALDGAPAFRVVEGAAEAVIFEMHYWFGHMQQDAARTVVFRHGWGTYSHTDNARAATAFYESAGTRQFVFTDMTAYLRGVNTGLGGDDAPNIVNDGGRVWILGHKAEDFATKVATTNHGCTDLLGATYRQNWDRDDGVHLLLEDNPLFIVDNACANLSFCTWKEWYKDPAYNYKYLVRETREGLTRTLVHQDYDTIDGASGTQALYIAGAKPPVADDSE
jgi:hypothetical protein